MKLVLGQAGRPGLWDSPAKPSSVALTGEEPVRAEGHSLKHKEFHISHSVGGADGQ